MPFIRIPGLQGKIYVPDEQPRHMKKHNCKDCFSCQMCSDDRCGLCRGKRSDCRINQEAEGKNSKICRRCR